MSLIKEGVLGVVFNENRRKVLLLKRFDAKLFVIPGGGIDDNESPEEAVLRELNEETGCTFSIKRKVAEYIPINRLSKVTHLFECELTNGKPRPGNEAEEIDFYSLNMLPTPLFHIHGDFIDDSMNEKTAPIVKKLTQVTYWKFIKYILKHPMRFFRFFLSRFSKK